MSTQHIPQAILTVALPMRANVSRHYDSQGKHVAYSYRHPISGAIVYRGTVSGMLSLLRQLRHDSKIGINPYHLEPQP